MAVSTARPRQARRHALSGGLAGEAVPGALLGTVWIWVRRFGKRAGRWHAPTVRLMAGFGDFSSEVAALCRAKSTGAVR